MKKLIKCNRWYEAVARDLRIIHEPSLVVLRLANCPQSKTISALAASAMMKNITCSRVLNIAATDRVRATMRRKSTVQSRIVAAAVVDIKGTEAAQIRTIKGEEGCL